MAKKELTEPQKRQQNVEEAVSATEKFFNENKKWIYGCLIALLVIGLGILAYSRFYLQPKKAEAAAELFPAEQNFAAGNFALALNGDGNDAGFLDILDQYGAKAGQAVYLYAGVCELQLGQYEEAIAHLKGYKGKDHILLARAQACIGDAYVGLGDYGSAVAWFLKAAKTSDDLYSAAYLLKAGVADEALGEPAKALACYKEIKDRYPQSIEAMDIDKYISRIGAAE